MNTEFSYLYRDAANYKKFGTLILTGVPIMGLEAFKTAILALMNEDECFIASQVAVPEVFLWKEDYPVDEDDHSWHQFDGIEETDAISTDARTPEQFLAAFEAANKAGWKEFEPAD